MTAFILFALCPENISLHITVLCVCTINQYTLLIVTSGETYVEKALLCADDVSMIEIAPPFINS